MRLQKINHRSSFRMKIAILSKDDHLNISRVTERPGMGLQNPLRRFDSDHGVY